MCLHVNSYAESSNIWIYQLLPWSDRISRVCSNNYTYISRYYHHIHKRVHPPNLKSRNFPLQSVLLHPLAPAAWETGLSENSPVISAQIQNQTFTKVLFVTCNTHATMALGTAQSRTRCLVRDWVQPSHHQTRPCSTALSSQTTAAIAR